MEKAEKYGSLLAIRYSDIDEMTKFYLRRVLGLLYADKPLFEKLLKRINPEIFFNKETACVRMHEAAIFNRQYREAVLEKQKEA